jgi:hypothetical protein
MTIFSERLKNFVIALYRRRTPRFVDKHKQDVKAASGQSRSPVEFEISLRGVLAMTFFFFALALLRG